MKWNQWDIKVPLLNTLPWIEIEIRDIDIDQCVFKMSKTISVAFDLKSGYIMSLKK